MSERTTTECCGVPDIGRYCAKCGQECRLEPSGTTGPADALWRVAKGDTGIGGSIVYRGTEVSEGLFTNETEWFNVGGKGNAQMVCDALNAVAGPSDAGSHETLRGELWTQINAIIQCALNETDRPVSATYVSLKRLSKLRDYLAASASAPAVPREEGGAAPTSTPLDALRAERLDDLRTIARFAMTYGDDDVENAGIRLMLALDHPELLAASPASALVTGEKR
jgi:hypothetical protein